MFDLSTESRPHQALPRYKDALRGLFAKHGAVPVFYEVARVSAKGGHAHVQAVPVPVSLQNEVEAAFLREGRALGVDFEPDADGALEASSGSARSYFRVDLPDGRKLVHLMKNDVPFSVQFGRYVLQQAIVMMGILGYFVDKYWHLS